MISAKSKSVNLTKVPVNLLQIAVVTRETERQKEFERIRKEENGLHSTYFELQEMTTDDGIIQQLVEVDYPITADYVKSHAVSADYRNDIQGAMANSVGGTNLGDITALQELLAKDLSEVKKLQAKILEAQTQTQKQSQPQTQPQDQKTSDKDGVING